MFRPTKKILFRHPIASFIMAVISILFALPYIASAVVIEDITTNDSPVKQHGAPAIQWVIGIILLLAIIGLITGIVLAIKERKNGQHKSLALVLIIISSIVVVLAPFVWAMISFGLSS